ncbi:transglutaminase family protein [Candidatus Lokiarchaeum ossiferum]|uniref:transglutaminase family protein n=1 Tax=Candidatus Lokiarchaeum ossiferum TaxID=2951803 RepID=UPI00352ECA38
MVTKAFTTDSIHKKFLKPTYFINSNHDLVHQKAQELLQGIDPHDFVQIAVKLFYFVRDEIKYVVKFSPSYYSRKNTRASSTLARGYGYCIQKATLMASLTRIAGIPTRLHFVDMKNHLTPQSYIDKVGSNLFVYHAYPELFLNGKWVEANVAFDKELCERKNFPIVNFDGIKPGLFAKQDDSGKPFVEYIKDHGTFADVPYWKIMWAWKQEYKFKILKGFKK